MSRFKACLPAGIPAVPEQCYHNSMVAELWRVFPRLIEQNINGLLDTAEPNALRQLQIFRRLKSDGLSRDNVPSFQRNIEEFFSRPRAERRKSQFDAFLDRPMDSEVYSLFQLDFRTAAITDKALHDVASWAHNLIRVSKKTTSAFMSLDVMLRVLRRITSPSRFDKAQDIDFSDFCSAWKRTVSGLFGNKHDQEFDGILVELHWLNNELKKSDKMAEARVIETALVPGVYLTQTEIDWTIAVRKAAGENGDIPKFPLSRGPEKQVLKDLERVIALYTAAQTSQLPEIIRNKENIRTTLIDRCETLLGPESNLEAVPKTKLAS